MIKRKLATLLTAGAMTIAIPLVSYFEGRSNHAYLDVVGVPTICDGITQGVRLGQYKTNKECDELLRKELSRSVYAVQKHVTVPISEPTKAALASFVYNVGEGNFKRSTLLKKLNSGDTVGACNELRRWIYAGGKPWKGLINRREVERWLCLQGVD